MSKSIDAEIDALKEKKHVLAIKRNLRNHKYDALFITHNLSYKYVVHFAYEPSDDYSDSFAVLCKGGDWLSTSYAYGRGGKPDGSELDIVRLLDNDAIFMTWNEAMKNLCPECSQYLSLKDVLQNKADALKLEADTTLKAAETAKKKLYKQARRLELAETTPPDDTKQGQPTKP